MVSSSRLDKARTVIELRAASLKLGGRQLWQNLNLDVAAGEFVAVLGPNGSGKSSLIKVLLGIAPISSGVVTINGAPPHRGSSDIGYVPQQKGFDVDLAITGRDLVHLGLDGYRFGLGWHAGKGTPEVSRVIKEVGASAYASSPIGLLSGGEQQRLRIAQALLGNPRVLLCDEPLLSLDMASQQAVSELIDERRKRTGAAVLFVTHDINPVMSMVDKVLYLVGHRWAVGKPSEVLTSERLSQLYDWPIDVLRVKGKVIIVGGGDGSANGGHQHIAASNGRDK